MGASSRARARPRRVALAGFAALAFALAACDALLGLGQFKDVTCGADCGADGGEGGGIVAPDATGDAVAVPDAGPAADAADAADALPDVVVMPEGGWPTPTAHELWAHWPMPNPDASIGDDAATPLPNQMTYDAGPDGDSVVYDAVTGLTWFAQSMQATSYDQAWQMCKNITVQVAGPWRVPTRIELVSLIDFTRAPIAIDTAVFPTVTSDRYWTSSAVGGGDGSAGFWAVDFGTGWADYLSTATSVLCVSGGTP